MEATAKSIVHELLALSQNDPEGMVGRELDTASHAVHFGHKPSVIQAGKMGYLGVPVCCHQSGTAQTTAQAVPSAASPSWHAHLCQSGMQVLFQVRKPAKR